MTDRTTTSRERAAASSSNEVRMFALASGGLMGLAVMLGLVGLGLF